MAKAKKVTAKKAVKKVTKTIECPDCNGRGLIDETKICDVCNGSGKIKE